MAEVTEHCTILAIETSCDETAAAVIRDGREIVSNVVASQMHLHERYGGVVPELASREHITNFVPVLREALAPLPGGWDDVDAIACTYGPGLPGALLAGVNAAKGLAWARGKPLVAVNHLEAHIYANWLIVGSHGAEDAETRRHGDTEIPGADDQRAAIGDQQANQPEIQILQHPTSKIQHPKSPEFPLVCLIVSGGHTALVLLRDHGDYELLGQTRDDAAGEAFDKAARLMGLGYPGGPRMEKLAAGVEAGDVVVPRAWLGDSFDFSFSGVKTHVLHATQRARGDSRVGIAETHPDYTRRLAAAFQESIVDVLATKTVAAAERFGAQTILLAGGVAANRLLRETIAARSPVPVQSPPIWLCTDNAAMVGAAGYYRYDQGLQRDWSLSVKPNLRLL